MLAVPNKPQELGGVPFSPLFLNGTAVAKKCGATQRMPTRDRAATRVVLQTARLLDLPCGGVVECWLWHESCLCAKKPPERIEVTNIGGSSSSRGD